MSKNAIIKSKSAIQLQLQVAVFQDGDACGFCKQPLKKDSEFSLPDGVVLLGHDEEEA